MTEQMRRFRARFENPETTIHAVEVWFKAENIVEAAEFIGNAFAAAGLFKEHVTKLIDITPEVPNEVREIRPAHSPARRTYR